MGGNEEVATAVAKMAIAAGRVGECVIVEPGEGLRFRLPAISDLAPINPDAYALVQSQQEILVSALLIDAFMREGWHAHLSDDSRKDVFSAKILNICVDVNYDNMNAGYDPCEPCLIEVCVCLRLSFVERMMYS